VTRSLVYHQACKETSIYSYDGAYYLAGAHFLTIHNVFYQLDLMSKARKAIKEDRYPDFVRNFFSTLYRGDQSRYPKWAVDALNSVGINLLQGQGVAEAETQVATEERQAAIQE
jgi:queuine tRNA-ribosyltransferase catalytic subunit